MLRVTKLTDYATVVLATLAAEPARVHSTAELAERARLEPPTVAKVLKPADWNDYVIRAEGRHVQLWLNGQKTVDYTEPDATIPQEGVFGLQIHQGAPSEELGILSSLVVTPHSMVALWTANASGIVRRT